MILTMYDDSNGSYEKIPMTKTTVKKIQMKKIKFINLFFKKTIYLTSSHPEMLENFFYRNIRNFCFSSFTSTLLKYNNFFSRKVLRVF